MEPYLTDSVTEDSVVTSLLAGGIFNKFRADGTSDLLRTLSRHGGRRSSRCQRDASGRQMPTDTDSKSVGITRCDLLGSAMLSVYSCSEIRTRAAFASIITDIATQYPV